MRETGTLNRNISDILSTLGHTDELIVCDAGFPIPVGVRTVDISLSNNIPTLPDALEELVQHFSIEKMVVAQETQEVNPTRFQLITDIVGSQVPVEIIPHAEFKKRSKTVKAVIRTGDFTAYSNVLLVSAGGGRWYLEKPNG